MLRPAHLIAAVLSAVTALAAADRPNVILVMTDDQGWGEVGFHGNKVLKTPNLDRFAAEGTELTQFYVSPMCTPTRSSLMTGRYHFRTGAHDTYIGRSNMKPQETTIAEVFAGAGYRTGIFGKWHLGENYPMRAVDQGFQKVVVHGGGGIGQFADYPGNSYWDPMLLHNDTFKRAKGYCTDVFIDESISFIKDAGKRPFFCYIPLNVPHAPFDVDNKFKAPYAAQVKEKGRQWTPGIYGMITQFDGAFQRLLDAVEKMGLRENTIIIFMTDNGPNSTYYTAGLRAKKSSVYENGFRVPFAIQWPAGIKGGRKLNDPTMHIDLLPTLAAACGIPLPGKLKVDGQSILPLLAGEVKKLPERHLFMQHNRGNVPPKYRNCMVRKGPWKVVGNRGTPQGFELYNIDQDPGETKNLADAHPDKVKSHVRAYETWFEDVTADLQRTKGVPHPIELNPIQKQDYRFTWQDWWGEKAGWQIRNYGRWRMNNPGLIKRFDVTILPHRQHLGQPSEVKFIWQGKELARRFEQTPERIVFENVELAKGTEFMEAQLHIKGKMWGAHEVRIKAHGAASTLPTSKPVANAPRHSAKPSTPSKSAKPSNPLPLPKISGQFIRIELPGRNRILSLAEVKVLEKGINLALNQKATQSTQAHGGAPARAVDGNVDGAYHNGSVTHTEPNGTNPWWEVDLGKVVKIEEIVVYNRTDGRPTRLDGFTLKVLDAKRKVVFSQENIAQSKVISFRQAAVKSSTEAAPIRKHNAAARKKASVKVTGKTYVIDSQEDWQRATATRSHLEFKDGMATPTAKNSTFSSVLITSEKKRSAKSLTIDQSPVWHNWEPIPNLGPSNLGDAPVMLTLGPGNYWMFGRYGGKKKTGFKSEPATLEGYDVPLRTTPFPNQYDAPGGLNKSLGGYHAWQSKDMVTWVHHGPVTEGFSSWVTTAEYADGRLYIYYDYPNDQDPHLYIDDNLTDGKPGKNMGMAFNDPSHGSDCAFIRDLQGNFHAIYEDWSPIDASTHSWDSPLAGHAVSADGIGDFKILKPSVDVRTKPTGKFAEYPHPHWHATDPKKYPGKAAPVDVPQHRIKKGQVRAFAKYEIHEPEQDAFGDWAAISIGGRYYLFADYHPANDKIRVGWFTSPSIDQQFTFCGEIGRGHPDPDIAFAEGKFYLATQMSKDYVSPGPWVETVEARVGVDTDNDGSIDQWTDWQQVKESYDYTPGFSKQVAKTPAKLDLSNLPEGYGFQFEVRMTDTTENDSKPILDKITLLF